MLPETGRSDRLGYVLKRYPRLSETFIVTELLAREAAGEDIAIAGLRAAGDLRFHPAIAAVRPRHVGARGTRPARVVGGAAHRPPRPARPARRAARAAGLPPTDAAQVLHVARWARTGVHAHFATLATTVARLAAAITGVPYAFTAHAKDIFHASVDPAVLRAKLADAHHVVTVTRPSS